MTTKGFMKKYLKKNQIYNIPIEYIMSTLVIFCLNKFLEFTVTSNIYINF